MKDDVDPFNDPGIYRRLVGRLNYLTVTRPDIAFAISVVSQFMSAPNVKHWAALEQILCYLKGVPGLGILYSNRGHSHIECFADADWAGSKIDRRSTTGYCVFVGGNLVSWRSKKQNVVSRSNAESEYRAMAQTTCEVMWIHHLLTEIGIKHTTPTKLWKQEWEPGKRGNCYGEKLPIKNQTNETNLDLPTTLMVEKVLARLGSKVSVLNITRLTAYRKDGHPSIYRQFYSILSPEELANPASYSDCIHRCLPGVSYLWNELLF
ncbi:uncharacterized mitochondrial protein AtMg00810-like [Nicotiana sylvestris]|uniref:uncharacterized mitochondrial protein AtMg00810-like n=1 Tax=Nicotiana sylvestris TaxID=4096 RepID=UPI00388C70FD